jgi:YesN/AraC family two-component response regulator
MSGFSEQEAMQRCAQLGVSEFMSKPFELSVLIEKLDRAQ